MILLWAAALCTTDAFTPATRSAAVAGVAGLLGGESVSENDAAAAGAWPPVSISARKMQLPRMDHLRRWLC